MLASLLCRRLLFGVATLLFLASPLACAADSAEAATGLTTLLLGMALVILVALLACRRWVPAQQRIARGVGRREIACALRDAQFDSLGDFVLPGVRNGLVHIDRAVLTSAGIVCIRIKQDNGVVHGDARDPQWKSRRDGQERTFLNPVIQNNGRVTALRQVLPTTPIVSLVVFTGDANLSAVPADNVIHVSELINWLQDFKEQQAGAAVNTDAWTTLSAAALTDEASIRDFRAQLSFS